MLPMQYIVVVPKLPIRRRQNGARGGRHSEGTLKAFYIKGEKDYLLAMYALSAGTYHIFILHPEE